MKIQLPSILIDAAQKQAPASAFDVGVDEFSSKKTRTSLFWFGIFLSILLVFSSSIYLSWTDEKRQIENLSKEHYAAVNQNLVSMFQQHQRFSTALAASLTQNEAITAQLCGSCDESLKAKLLNSYEEKVKRNAFFEDVTLQIIDANGISVYSSWTLDRGENISLYRMDVKSVLNDPKIVSGLVADREALTLKVLAPVFDDNKKLLGIVEVTSFLKSFVNKQKFLDGSDSVVLVDAFFTDQMLIPQTKHQIGRRLVAATTMDVERVGELLKSESDALYWLEDNLFVSKHPLRAPDMTVLGHWYNFAHDESVFGNRVSEFSQRMLWLNILLAATIISLGLFFFQRRSRQREKQEFADVYNAIDEIVLIYKHGQLVDFNQAFYYQGFYQSIDDFRNDHPNGVSSLFVDEPGMVSGYSNDQRWIDDLETHQDEPHLVKMELMNVEKIFRIKLCIPNDAESRRIIVLRDVTEVVAAEKRINQQATIDPLTKISNRIVFLENLEREILVSRRYNTHISVALMDLDHFNRLNNDFGQEVGDLVLKNTAKTVNDFLRETDKVSRFSGEQFAILMPQTNLKFASFTAERLRGTIEFINPEGLPENVTVSVSVTELLATDGDQPTEKILKRLDSALHQAKRNGRNTVMVAKSDYDIVQFNSELFD